MSPGKVPPVKYFLYGVMIATIVVLFIMVTARPTTGRAIIDQRNTGQVYTAGQQQMPPGDNGLNAQQQSQVRNLIQQGNQKP